MRVVRLGECEAERQRNGRRNAWVNAAARRKGIGERMRQGMRARNGRPREWRGEWRGECEWFANAMRSAGESATASAATGIAMMRRANEMRKNTHEPRAKFRPKFDFHNFRFRNSFQNLLSSR